MQAANRPDQRSGPILRHQSAARTAPAAGPRLSMKARSRGYLDALAGIDTASAATGVDTGSVRERVAAELAAARIPMPMGIAARCHLGGSYVVHTLTWDMDDVVAHYKRGEPLPDGLERARALAASSSYAAVEVYPEHLLCLRADGTVIRLEQ